MGGWEGGGGFPCKGRCVNSTMPCLPLDTASGLCDGCCQPFCPDLWVDWFSRPSCCGLTPAVSTSSRVHPQVWCQDPCFWPGVAERQCLCWWGCFTICQKSPPISVPSFPIRLLLIALWPHFPLYLPSPEMKTICWEHSLSLPLLYSSDNQKNKLCSSCFVQCLPWFYIFLCFSLICVHLGGMISSRVLLHWFLSTLSPSRCLTSPHPYIPPTLILCMCL